MDPLLLLLQVGLKHGGDEIGVGIRVWMRGEAGDSRHGGETDGIAENSEDRVEFRRGDTRDQNDEEN